MRNCALISCPLKSSLNWRTLFASMVVFSFALWTLSRSLSEPLVAYAHPPYYANKTPQWYACRQNQDCKVLAGVCGSAVCLNSKFEKQFLLSAKKQAPFVECEKSVSDITSVQSTCVSNACECAPKH